MGLENLPAFRAALRRIEAEAETAAKKTVERSLAIVEAKAKRNFAGAHAKGQPHVGGQLPNIVSGTLRRGIISDPVRQYGAGDYGGSVGPTTVYARRVELDYGYAFFTPAVEDSTESIDAVRTKTWRDYVH